MARWRAGVEFLLSVIGLLFLSLMVEPSTKVLRCRNFPKMGITIKVAKFVIFWTISTIQDEKSAAKFHYIKNVSDKVVAQSIAFLVVSIYWQGATTSPEILAPSDLLPPEAASFHTFCLVAPQPQEIEKEVQLHLTRARAFQRAINQGSMLPLTSSKWG